MNEMYYRINRKLTDPLYDAKCTKREINKNFVLSNKLFSMDILKLR